MRNFKRNFYRLWQSKWLEKFRWTYFSLADFHTKYQLVDMWVLNFRAEEVIQIKREMLNYILSLEEKKDSLQNYVVEDKITNVFLSLTFPLLEIQQVKK